MKAGGSTLQVLARALLLVGLTGVAIGAPLLSWLLESRAHLSEPVALVGSSGALVCSTLILLYVLGRGETGGGSWPQRLKAIFSRKKLGENRA